jgi:hypothetical protein
LGRGYPEELVVGFGVGVQDLAVMLVFIQDIDIELVAKIRHRSLQSRVLRLCDEPPDIGLSEVLVMALQDLLKKLAACFIVDFIPRVVEL